jgi:hypothetical protein
LTAFVIIFIILGIFVLLFALVALIMALVFFMLFQMGSWKSLAQHYGTTSDPTGTIYKGQTIKVGAIRWRFATTIGVSAHGLYISVAPLPGFLSRIVQHPPLLIPWSDIRFVGPGHIYQLWQAVELSIGNPSITSITVTKKLYEEVLSHYLPTSD